MEKDNSIDLLFKNRIDVMKYLLKYRKKTLVKLLLLVLPFCLPFLVWLIYSRYFFYSFPIDNNQAILYVLTNNFPSLFLIFLYSIGMAGMYYSIRRMYFSDTVNVKYHFFKGIKDTGFEFGLFSSIIYIIYTILDIININLKINLNNRNTNIIIYIIISGLILLFELFILYILTYILSSASLYVVSFIQAIKDAFNNFKINFMKNVKYFLLGYFPFIFLYFYSDNNFMIINIVASILILFYTNLFGVLFQSTYIYDSFDETINKNNYIEYYKAGISKGEKDETRN